MKPDARWGGVMPDQNKTIGLNGCALEKSPLILLKKGYYYSLVVPAENHALTRNGFWGDIVDPQTVHVEANQTVYFSYYHVPFSSKVPFELMSKLLPAVL